MKKLTAALSILSGCVLYLSCSDPESSIEGVYVNQLQDEISIAWDTIVISRSEGTERMFQIEKRTGYRRIKHGKLQPKQFAGKTWMAHWDEKAGAFAPSWSHPPIRLTENGLLLKSTAYRKIK